MNKPESYLNSNKLDVSVLHQLGFVLRPTDNAAAYELPPVCVIVPPVKEGQITIVQRREHYVMQRCDYFANIFYYVYGSPDHAAIEQSHRAFQESMLTLRNSPYQILEATSIYVNHTIVPTGIDPVSYYKASDEDEGN